MSLFIVGLKIQLNLLNLLSDFVGRAKWSHLNRLPLKASNGDSPEFADPGNTAEVPALGSFPLDLNLCLDFD